MSIEPKPTTIELTGADAKFGRVLVDATRVIAKRLGLQMVYDRFYLPSTTEFELEEYYRRVPFTIGSLFLTPHLDCEMLAKLIGLRHGGHKLVRTCRQNRCHGIDQPLRGFVDVQSRRVDVGGCAGIEGFAAQ